MSDSLDTEAIRPPLTPMIDIAFLVLIFFMCLPFKTLASKLEAFLPTTSGIDSRPQPPPPESVKIRIRALADGGHGYRIGDHAMAGLDALEPLLRKLGAEYRYEVEADSVVAWQAVVGVVDLLTALKFNRVAFRGTRIPPASLRRARILPRPEPDPR